ncbi:MAG: RNA polymerase sporulation sigma factor SigK [Acutalibacteraceae bacterium]|nr:RNA polymerase sporulation sigma factor SigK [Acutalibacteraceae bacterium]
MLLALLSDILSKISLIWILHVTGAGLFPRPLSAKEEKELLLKTAQGDINARNTLVEHNLRLVAHIVKKYYGTGADPDDLVSIGTIGLIKAVNTYNHEKNIKLSSYASRCIENEILMYFRSTRKNALDISINEEIDADADGNALTLMDVMATEDTIVEDLDLKIKAEKLSGYIRECLTAREAMILRLRYGLQGTKPLTQREVADHLKISRSYVSRIEKKALQKLRKRYGSSTL